MGRTTAIREGNVTTSVYYLRLAGETDELVRHLSRDDDRQEARKIADLYRRRAAELAERERSFQKRK
jgi:hypothetical protein